ncbi:MFS transporter [Treponema sp. TIM-1]|uniref:MFS transporter n=1 Tax=Treponema sp. TIM-1 TaxID=2898417 RepID=UPI00397F610B
MSQESKLMKYLQILALGLAGGSIYLIPYIRYVFYDWQIEAMGITNTQIGLLTTVYTIGNVILYIPGGIIADKFSTKKCILISLISTTILTFIFAFTMGSYVLALVIWFLFAVTTTFLFWDALMKTIRLIGDESEQGFMFGLYYMGNGLTGAIVNAIGVRATNLADTSQGKFFWGVIVYGIATAVAALFVALLLKDKQKAKIASDGQQEEGFRFSMVGGLLKSPTVWIFSIIVFTGYAVFSNISYFNPYMTDVIGITPEDSAYLSIIRGYIFYVLTPLSGIIADKVVKSTSKWFVFLFFILAALLIGVLLIPEGASVGLVSFYSLLPGLFGLALYGIIFSIAAETKISAAVMGTAVGIASIIGYAPDFFMATMFGSWLDKMGNGAYRLIFIFLAANCVVGFVASLIVRFQAKKALLK